MASLTARRHGLSWRYTVFEDGQEVGRIRVGFFQTGEIRTATDRWAVRRPGPFARAWALEHEGDSSRGRRGEAVKPSPLRNIVEVQAEGRRVTLRRIGFMGYRFEVDEGGHVAATIRATFIAGRIETDMPDDWPLALRLFLLWLVPVAIRRAAATTAAGGG